MKLENIKSLIDNVIFLDIETSGLNPYNSEILEIGAIKIENNNISSFHTFVKNEKEVPLEIFSLCKNLKEEDLSKAPNLYMIKDKFINFLENKQIICHDIEFKEKFLNYYFRDRCYKNRK